MGTLAVLAFTFSLVVVSYAAKCGDISGRWENELGSWMILRVDISNRISGEYHTAVESTPGAAANASNITGLFYRDSDGSLLAFSVLFNQGASLTSWVGQCMVCEEKEVLFTTYNFRKHVENPQQKWASIVVNQNTFWRTEDKPENSIEVITSDRFPHIRSLSVLSQKRAGGLDLTGKWKSNDNEILEIFGENGDILEGKRQETDVIGRKDGNDTYTAVALMSPSDKRMRTWTGYIFGDFVSTSQLLEMSWLEHEFNPNCTSPRNIVRFGIQNFIREAAGSEYLVNKSETFLDKIRKFFSSMF